jgi:glycosyltransferase involved in cell wall biosynthesis
MKTLTIVIPALNEEEGIGPVIKDIPVYKLKDVGYETEILVVDNGSQDRTPHIARDNGARVIIQPMRGYGNAYKAGFANASGEVIATGDADLTYPFAVLPELLLRMEREDLDFINTDRLTNLNRGVMSPSHQFGNRVLTFMMRILFRWPFIDSQSGMWIFRKSVWDKLEVSSSGMAFSQELKIEAFIKGFKCAEVPIQYRMRLGKVKLSTVKNGIENMSQLLCKRVQILWIDMKKNSV